MKPYCLACAFMLTLIGFAAHAAEKSGKPQASKPKATVQRRAAPSPAPDDRCAPIRDLQELGVIMDVRNDGFDIYVSGAWYRLPLKTKEATAIGMLECLGHGHRHVNIYDGYSGKKVARYGSAWGFTSYE